MQRSILIAVLSLGLSLPAMAEKERATKGVSNDVRESGKQGVAEDQDRKSVKKDDDEKGDDDEEHGEGKVKPKATPVPKAKPKPQKGKKPSPTAVPTAAREPAKDHEEEEMAPAPRKTATFEPEHARDPERDHEMKPTAEPALRPTVAPAREREEEATAVPARIPTQAATAAPAREPGEEATALPTLAPSPSPTVAPTEIPTQAPTAVPTAVPIQQPTPVPTRPLPTAVPSQAWPTPAPTVGWMPEPTPVPGSIRAKGRRIDKGEARHDSSNVGGSRFRTRNTYQYESSGSGGGTVIQTAPRDPNKLSGLMLSLPIGMGKPYDVKPAFKPQASDLNSRNIDGSGFAGLGIEGRLWPMLRIFGDWTAYNHYTRAVVGGAPAPAVDVPGVASVLADTDMRYAMNTHGFRIGAKLGLPLGAHVEPWIGGGAGLYLWTAEYRDALATVSYGKDSGTEWGLTGMGGIDLNFSVGGLLLRASPFGEIGSPVVNPTIVDIAGSGATWHDKQGVAVMVPRRLGLMLAIGY